MPRSRGREKQTRITKRKGKDRDRATGSSGCHSKQERLLPVMAHAECRTLPHSAFAAFYDNIQAWSRTPSSSANSRKTMKRGTSIDIRIRRRMCVVCRRSHSLTPFASSRKVDLLRVLGYGAACGLLKATTRRQKPGARSDPRSSSRPRVASSSSSKCRLPRVQSTQIKPGGDDDRHNWKKKKEILLCVYLWAPVVQLIF